MFGELDNLELFEYTQHSDSIISWRSLGLHWDAFQMCLNNRGIELPLKWALEIKGSNLLSHHSLQTIISFLLGLGLLFSVILSFPLSVFFLFIVSIGAFLVLKLPFFPHSPLSHWSTTKMQDRGECEGALEFHMQRVNTATARKTHTQEQTQHLPGCLT